AKEARLDRAAGLLDELGEAQEAETLYRRHAAEAKEPTSVLLLARHLAGHGHLPEALDLCDQAWKTCPPEPVANVSVTLLRVGGGDAQQQGRVERRLAEALARNPRSTWVLGSMAELQDLRGRVDEAAEWYRKVLQVDERNVAALNNLA